MELNPNAEEVLRSRYLDEHETPDGMFERVSLDISKAELNYTDSEMYRKRVQQEFYEIMDRQDFLPNSPTLMNAGRDLQQLAACYVLPLYDSMDSIFDGVKYAALVHKGGGGTGFSFSELRPEGDRVKSTGGVASGPISFLKVFNAATEAVKQGGVRRGANMGVLNIHHPDVLKFVACKEDNDEITNFNISVAITDRFMDAVIQGTDYELINPRDGRVEGKLDAAETLELISKMAWRNGEPGILFIDRINEQNPTPKLGNIRATNPCGEQPLMEGESCTLGSINLKNMITSDGKVNWARLESVTRTSTRFLDNVIDRCNYPLDFIADKTRSTRKIGIGVMGLHEALIKMRIPYSSEEGLNIGAKIMEFINQISKEESMKLARERGVFPEWDNSIYEEEIRNATTTTIAPTGSISIIAGASSGIEPLFALAMTRNHDLVDGEFFEVNSLFAREARERGIYSEELKSKVAKNGTLEGINEIPEDMKNLYETSHDINESIHVRMQAAFQQHTDNAVSKTVNLPEKASVPDVMRIYTEAYLRGCKGVTVYRDNSRDNQVLSKGSKGQEIDKPQVKEVDEEVDEGQVVTCDRCGEKYQSYESACSWCPGCGARECS